MTTHQPEALRLADELNAYHTAPHHKEAAAELRRLHWENLKFSNALKKCSRQLTELGYSANHADEALGKAKGEIK